MNLELAAELCKRFEGFRSKPYLCPANVATIGYGSTYYANGVKVTLNDPPTTQEEAHVLLMHELEHTYLQGVLRNCPILMTDSVNAMPSWTSVTTSARADSKPLLLNER